MCITYINYYIYVIVYVDVDLNHHAKKGYDTCLSLKNHFSFFFVISSWPIFASISKFVSAIPEYLILLRSTFFIGKLYTMKISSLFHLMN